MKIQVNALDGINAATQNESQEQDPSLAFSSFFPNIEQPKLNPLNDLGNLLDPNSVNCDEGCTSRENTFVTGSLEWLDEASGIPKTNLSMSNPLSLADIVNSNASSQKITINSLDLIKTNESSEFVPLKALNTTPDFEADPLKSNESKRGELNQSIDQFIEQSIANTKKVTSEKVGIETIKDNLITDKNVPQINTEMLQQKTNVNLGTLLEHSEISIQEAEVNKLDMFLGAKPLKMDALATKEMPQKSASYDAMFSNMVDFFNKKLAVSDQFSKVPATGTVMVGGEVYSKMEEKYQLASVQYNAADLVSLKVETYMAKLKVYPPDLGQITAEISMNKGVAELTLRSDNQQIRDFISGQVQQLRESFQNANLQLDQVSVQNNSMLDQRESGQSSHSFSESTQYPEAQKKERQLMQGEGQKSNLIIDTYA